MRCVFGRRLGLLCASNAVATKLRMVVFGVVWLALGSVCHAYYNASTWPALETSPAASQGRNGASDAAVIVAIERYAHLAEVPGAEANGHAWYRYLTETMHVPAGRITRLSDRDAVDYRIRNVLKERADGLRPGGRLWFIFIGHGAPSRHAVDGGENDGLLIGYDADDSVEGLESRSLRRSILMTLLGARNAAGTESVAIIDACFSGRTHRGEIVRGLQPVAIVDRAVPKSVVVLTAASGDEFAGGLPGTSRPAFSYLLLGALRGWGDGNGDGYVTAREAVDYTKDTLATVLRGERTQHPTLDAYDEGIVLGKGSERGPNLSAPVAASEKPTWGASNVTRYGTLGGDSSSEQNSTRMVPDSRLHSTKSDDENGRRALLVTSLTLAAAGGITTVVGLGLWASASASVQEITASCPSRTGCSDTLQAEYNDAQSRARTGNYVIPVGVGVLAVGAVLFIVHQANVSRSPRSLSVGVGSTGAALGYRWQL